jgi:hypothetical protein
MADEPRFTSEEILLGYEIGLQEAYDALMRLASSMNPVSKYHKQVNECARGLRAKRDQARSGKA